MKKRATSPDSSGNPFIALQIGCSANNERRCFAKQ